MSVSEQPKIDMQVFKRDIPSYLNKPDPIREYLKQSAVFISKVKSIPFLEAYDKVKKVVNKSNYKNPIVRYMTKLENGDQVEETAELTHYIKSAQAANQVIVPSFTTYIHPNERLSLHSAFINLNVNARKEDKKLAFKYKMEGNKSKADFYDNMQKTRKIFNNSLSGSYASNGTILYNPSAHYTLTSITRSVSSIGNAVSESMIGGNKLFKDPESVLNYITAIITYSDLAKVDTVMQKYDLHYPTVDEVMEMIEDSTKWYWNIPKRLGEIRYYLTKLEPIELACVMYTNDFYNIRKYNDSMVRKLISSISELKTGYSTDKVKDIYNSPEGVANHAHNICSDMIKGINVDYEKMIDSPEVDAIASTTKYVSEVLTSYKDFFHAFFITDIAPVNIAYMKEMIRNSIVLSDTDSTCGAYDDWVRWYFQEERYASDAKHIAIASSVMTIVTQVMDHYIKILCGNMNIAPERFELLKMKNEYYWYSFITTNMTKHYFADTGIQEGKVYAQPEKEVKGVNLIASKVNKTYRKIGEEMMEYIKKCNREGELIDLHYLIKKVADAERNIIQKMKEGSLEVFGIDKIKPAGAYSDEPTKSNYVHYLLWEEVFADKYGHAMEPTYQVIKASTTLDSKKRMDDYLDSLEDQEIATKLRNFLSRVGKQYLGTYRIPLLIVSQEGLPSEVFQALNYKKVVNDNCAQLYTILEPLGFYKPKGVLVSEMGPY